MADGYVKPYVESSVFISWIRGEKGVVTRDGIVDCASIAETVLKDAESGEYQVVTSHLTIAEVFKKKGATKLTDTENGAILKYFEQPFIVFVEVDRGIAEEANRLCRRFIDQKLSPNDAIHLASALRAGCDVLLTWDNLLLDVSHQGVRIECPRITKLGPLFSQSGV